MPTPTPRPTPTPTPAGAAIFLGTDTATQGNWVGTYGSGGYVVAGDNIAPTAVNLPAGDAYINTGNGPFYYPSLTGSSPALQRPNGTGRVASAFYDPRGFNVTLGFSDTSTHRVALYLADFDSQNRTEAVQVFDSHGNALTSPVMVSSFSSGKYILFDVTGNVTFTFTHVAGGSTVLAGLFID